MIQLMNRKVKKQAKKQSRNQFDPAKAQLKDLIFKCNYGIPTKAAAAKIEARKNKIKKKDAEEEPGSPNVSQPKKKKMNNLFWKIILVKNQML